MKNNVTTSPLFNRISTFCNDHALIHSDDTIVVGFSGGPDSLFLLHFLAAQLPKNKIIAAHLDHGWRTESADEAQWCKKTATDLGIHCVIGHFNDYENSLKQRGSQEDLGRQARRRFFEQVAKENAANKIALAHHADDQLETFFVRLIRGAGIQGLAGMRPHQGRYIRPLLCVTKAEIVEYLEEQGIHYLTDPSNRSESYLRNRIRHTLIPALASCDPRAEKNIAASIEHIQEVDAYLDTQAQENFAKIFNEQGLDVHRLTQQHALIRHRILLLWLCHHGVPFTPTKGFFAEIERFLVHGTGSHCIAPGWSLAKKKNIAQLQKS